MGFHLKHLTPNGESEYIGGNTIHSAAAAGAFDSPVSKKLEKMADKDPSIMGIVDKNGIDHCINVLKSGQVVGRDVEKMIALVSDKFKNGFILVY